MKPAIDAGIRGDRQILDSVHVETAHERTNHTTRDLAWLELQFRLRHAIIKVGCQASSEIDSSEPDAGSEPSTLASRFGGAGLSQVVSEVDKLRRVNTRRQRYLELREKPELVDLLLRVRTTETVFEHIRSCESKGVSYWFRRTGFDYKENWLLKYSPVRRYYEQVTAAPSREPHTDKLGLRLITATPAAESARERKQARRAAE